MKFAAPTLLLATLALATPAPIAQPEAIAQPDSDFQPIKISSRAELTTALAARAEEAPAAPEIDARTAGIHLAPRDPKKSKPKSSKNSTDTGAAAGILAPSRALELGALGLGIVEVVRLWG